MKCLLLLLLSVVTPAFAQNEPRPEPKCLIVELNALHVDPAFNVLIGNVAVQKADFDLIEAVGWKPDLKKFGPDDLRRIRASGIRVFVVPVQGLRPGLDVKMAEAACHVPAP